jgi:ABC-type nitrate/sulfonate/bicarbonate transport system substrate-binding protein
MRLKFAGKVVLFALGLAGLYALWRQVPRRAQQPWRIPFVRLHVPEHRNVAAPQETAVPHEGILIGYAGAPPPATVDLSRPGVNVQPAFGRETNQAVSLRERETSAELLKDVGSGRLDAAVVDFPAVVYAARKGDVPFHVVLLVSWRRGADVLTVRGGGPWKPAEGIVAEPDASGAYLALAVLASGRYSPQDVTIGRKYVQEPAAIGSTPGSGAAAGRWDRLPREARGWPVWRRAEDMGLQMPDVLVVNTKWARRHPETVTELVRSWLRGQEAAGRSPANWKRFVREQAKGSGTDRRTLEESLRPAPLEDQLAFAGLREKGTRYAALVVRQLRTIESGPRPPDPRFTVPMDPAPLSGAAPLLVE